MPNQNPDLQTLMNRLRRLTDREEIKELKTRYARGADAAFNNPGAASATALADLFTDDGILALGPYGSFEGRAQLLNAFENILPLGTKWSTHYIVNPLIEFQSADQATGQWYYLIQSLPADPPDASVIQLFGSYDDKYVRTADGWKIKETQTSFFVPPT